MDQTSTICGYRLGVFLGFVFLLVLFAFADDAFRNYKFNHLTDVEHLQMAQNACGQKFIAYATSENESAITLCEVPVDALRHLAAIPQSASSFKSASWLQNLIRQQHNRNLKAWESKSGKEEAGTDQIPSAKAEAYEKMRKNFSAEDHDSFTCANSVANKPIVSFDEGKFWWQDDGRCALRQQKARDEDAEVHSYYSTSLRVDTDMDSSWLADEERTCESYPDDSGKVKAIRCPTSQMTGDHNIPVVFWGGVDRNTISSWKCRREKDILRDIFVCRAID